MILCRLSLSYCLTCTAIYIKLSEAHDLDRSLRFLSVYCSKLESHLRVHLK